MKNRDYFMKSYKKGDTVENCAAVLKTVRQSENNSESRRENHNYVFHRGLYTVLKHVPHIHNSDLLAHRFCNSTIAIILD